MAPIMQFPSLRNEQAIYQGGNGYEKPYSHIMEDDNREDSAYISDPWVPVNRVCPSAYGAAPRRVTPLEPQQVAIAQCKVNSNLSLKEKLDLINQSRETFGMRGEMPVAYQTWPPKLMINRGPKRENRLEKRLACLGPWGNSFKTHKPKTHDFKFACSKKDTW